MPRLAVVHADINAAGGAEAVCAHALEALSSAWDTTLITWRPPDFEKLDRLFGTSLARTTLLVRCVGDHHHPSFLAWRGVYQHAMAARLIQDSRDDYDAVVSTYCEIAARPPTLQYIHVPHYSERVPSEVITGVHTGLIGGLARRLGRVVWRRLARGSRRTFARNRTLANSAWTAGWIEKAWGIRAAVLWPPVPYAPTVNVPWESRENGFVCVGKLTPGKRVLELIDTVEALRGRGIDTHIHVVGDGTGPYAEAVRGRCTASNFAYYEGTLSVRDLTALLSSHKYGLHGFPWEHFGIAVAQIVRAGCLCFAPRGGGQAELLADSPTLLFDSPLQAVEQIARVVRDPALQHDLLTELDSIRTRLVKHHFGSAFKAEVQAMLGEGDIAKLEPDARRMLP